MVDGSSARSPAWSLRLRLRLQPCSDVALWDRLVLTLPGGTSFHVSHFLDLQERMLGVRIERHLLLADGQPVGALPVVRRSRRSLRSPWLPFPMLGPVVPEDLLPAALREFRRRQRRGLLVLGRFDVAPALAAAAPAAAGATGMQVREDGTAVLDLEHRSAATLDSRMTASRRQGIRRAERAGVHAREARPGEVSAVLDAALDGAYARRGSVNPYPAGSGARIEDWARGREDVFLGVVFDRDVLVGATVVLAGHSVAAGWVGACLPGARACNAEAVLLREAFLWAMRRGNAAIDFGGRVDDDVERFKLSFGARAARYVTVESFLGPQVVRRAGARLGR